MTAVSGRPLDFSVCTEFNKRIFSLFFVPTELIILLIGLSVMFSMLHLILGYHDNKYRMV